MKYLSDKITVTVNARTPLPSAGYYNYEIQEYEDYYSDYNTIFYASFYYKGSGSKEFDITDIVRNRKNVITNEVVETSENYIDNKLVRKYRVKVWWIPFIGTNSNEEVVIMAYSYPNIGKLSNPDSVCFNGYEKDYYFTIANQGFRDATRRMELIPHYPLKNTTNYNYMQALYIGQGTQDCWLRKVTDDGKGGVFGDYLRLNQQQYDLTSITYKQNLRDFIKGNYADYWAATTDVRLSDISVYQRGQDSTGTTNQIKVAIIDNCNERYYLQWQDRLGGFQSQALLDNVTYSESFDNETVQNYRNVKKKSTIGVNSKWKLSTGWISEDIFPIYESISVSPYLVLYDTWYDKAYNVMVTGDWTEKTFKNQKKLLNITFDFEADSKQNIIY